MSWANTKHTFIVTISVSISQPGKVPLRNTGNHPTSFLSTVPTFESHDLPTIKVWCPWHAGFADLVPLLGDAPGISASPIRSLWSKQCSYLCAYNRHS